jgi:hypothetical protein
VPFPEEIRRRIEEEKRSATRGLTGQEAFRRARDLKRLLREEKLPPDGSLRLLEDFIHIGRVLGRVEAPVGFVPGPEESLEDMSSEEAMAEIQRSRERCRHYLAENPEEQARERAETVNSARRRRKDELDLLIDLVGKTGDEAQNFLRERVFQKAKESLGLPLDCETMKGRVTIKEGCDSWHRLTDCIAVCTTWDGKISDFYYDPPGEE